ncbi:MULTISPECIES: ABC transporter ATP-binding protein [Microbacterium]|jgi:NitT/TauT family transport system ATP-binding protein|uniref:ABC transporter ATP-binding protein n=1 Tax=Microbacterium TaxID=33882 RepID=UPI001E4BFF86|nr:ABC transporter ATP-binding protein [Microbacterium nymphoidis]MCD2498898.1 ABC transporter ATP-binding protein [Microbacterium nymphoidis]
MMAAGAGVEVRGVSKSFGVDGKRVTVLDDISLTIGMGEFVSVIGPSGSGKSTLLKVVAGLLDADSGSVTIDGEPVREASRKKNIGLVPQSPALLPWKTVLENVRLPVQINRAANGKRQLRDPEELLRTFGLGHAIHKHPGQLSGGMQQRAAIARAFAFDPAIMLMDEPFSALDEMNRDLQRIALLDFWQSNRKAVMFVTHSVPEAIMLSDRVVVMSAHPGRIADVIDIDLPRPRDEDAYATDAFRDIEAVVRRSLRAQMEQVHV